MRPPRFRVRTLMLAVAVVAVAAGLWHRSERFRRLAQYHQQANVWIILDWGAVENAEKEGWNWVGTPPVKAVLPRPSKARILWHDALRLEYEGAARRPWLPVEPDPPEPE